MLNKVILMGRLTADPEYRQTPQGSSVCRFTIAIDRNFTSKTTGQKETDFISCVAWTQRADFVSRYFTKGKPIMIEGSLRNNNYTDQNGVKHYSMEINVDSVSFCLSDNTNNNNGANGYNANYGNNGYQQGGYSNGGYQGGYNNNYNQGGYAPQGNNGYYQAQPQQQPAPPVYQQPVNNSPVAPATVPNDATASNNDNLQIGNLDDFEEILSDGEIPF